MAWKATLQMATCKSTVLTSRYAYTLSAANSGVTWAVDLKCNWSKQRWWIFQPDGSCAYSFQPYFEILQQWGWWRDSFMSPRPPASYHNTSHTQGLFRCQRREESKQRYGPPELSTAALLKCYLWSLKYVSLQRGRQVHWRKYHTRLSHLALFLLGYILFWENGLIASDFSVSRITTLCLSKHNAILVDDIVVK